jgi:alpha-glucosidase (family GH31 glycosyl hydrolase)
MLQSFIILISYLSLIFAKDIYIVSPAKLSPTNYPRWAHYHWIWLHHDQSNQNNITNLVNDYQSYNIPVGGVNVDSEWATQFNNFEVNTEKFPNFSSMIDSFHNQDIHVIMW